MTRAVSFRPATDEEVHARNLLTAPIWGGRITDSQYLERERRLRATAFARFGLRTWVLVEGSSIHAPILASCESYRMTSVFDEARGVSQGIASVFVEERLRGHGYAARLLGLLLEKFREEGAQASILYSEVGAGIYARVGYRARPIRGRIWTPSAGDPSKAAHVFTRRESASVLEPMLRAAGTRPRFYIALDLQQLDWHRERASIYRDFLAPGRQDPDTLAGAVAGAAWIAWSPDYRNERLMVLAARPGTASESAALVEALRRATGALGLPLAELWESPAISLPGGETVPRDDEIPMIAPLVPGLDPELWIDFGRGCWI